MALCTILSMMTLGIGKCVADGSQGSYPMITSMHGRWFVRSIRTVMLVKEMLSSIELWQELSPECTIMNQRVRDNQCSGSTRCLRPMKNSRHRLPLGKSCWPSFEMSMALYWCTSRKRVELWIVLDTVMLVNEFKPAIQLKCRGLLSKRVFLLHDNASPHRAEYTVDTLHALKFEVSKHPPYSPDLAPLDFHLFGPMKEQLRSQKFADDNKVMEAVQSWLKPTPKSFYLEGIRKHVDRWTKCIAKQGDYVQK